VSGLIFYQYNAMRKIYFILFCAVLCGSPAFTQNSKQTESIEQVWLGYFNQARFSDRWGSWLDVHLRTKENFTSNLSQSILRLGLTYYFNENTRFTAGYAYVSHYPGDNHKDITQPEHRPWQQLQWNNKYSRLRTSQSFRLEEKFRRKIANESTLAEGYNFNYKLRYNFLLNVPLGKKLYMPGSLSFVVNDELHVNFGKQVVYNYFDQNRLFLGFSYQTNKHDNLQFGYLNIFQQLASGNRYKDIHAFRLFYFHILDLRGK
jgi:hypothetical protein